MAYKPDPNLLRLCKRNKSPIATPNIALTISNSYSLLLYDEKRLSVKKSTVTKQRMQLKKDWYMLIETEEIKKEVSELYGLLE